MYTDAMKRAVRSIIPPKGFGVDIIDNEHFITVRADEKSFMNLFRACVFSDGFCTLTNSMLG
jgi:hypothetical protein